MLWPGWGQFEMVSWNPGMLSSLSHAKCITTVSVLVAAVMGTHAVLDSPSSDSSGKGWQPLTLSPYERPLNKSGMEKKLEMIAVWNLSHP